MKEKPHNAIISFKLLSQFPEITHFSTTRHGGISTGNYSSFNLSPFSGDNEEHYTANINELCLQAGIAAEQLIIPFQNHGTEIREIDEAFLQSDKIIQQKMLNGVDALFTKEKNICIGVTTADCVPLLFYDSAKHITAAAHAGWRGTSGRIAEKTINTLKDKYNSSPSDIFALIGPSISVNAYNVGEEILNNFLENDFPAEDIFVRKAGKLYLDLRKANQWLLEQNGVPSNQIEITDICTYTNHNHFFSARRLGIRSGRILTGIMIRKALQSPSRKKAPSFTQTES